MDLATGAMASLLPKLFDLLKEEYNTQKGVAKDVVSLAREMETMHAALLRVAEVPHDQLDAQIKLWASDVRELSYDTEDVVDNFLLHVGGSEAAATSSDGFRGFMKKVGSKFRKAKNRHEIADAIRDIKLQIEEVAARRDRYRIDDAVSRPVAETSIMTTIDPRLRALYTEAAELVGIDGKRDQELIYLLSKGDDSSRKKLQVVSVVGFGGLGKTTLVRAVHDKMKGDFDCAAFVSVGRNASPKKVFMDILIDLGHTDSNLSISSETQLIDRLRQFLENKRYLIVIDDIWDEQLWGYIKLAFSYRNNLGSRLITTTRIVSVSNACCPSIDDSVYQMKPLSDDESKRLFNRRIFPHDSGCPHEYEQLSRDVLKKCGGVPLAIITVASRLVSSDHRVKEADEWITLLSSIGRGLTSNASVEEMQRIISFSYYDLPSHLKTCLSYLSSFPEDHEIKKDQLVWKWIGEGFVQCGKQQSSQYDFELGESYLNELINRSLVQPIYNHKGVIKSCRVHDMVFDLICSLACEENFVTVSDGTVQGTPNPRIKVRRLSLQNRNVDETKPLISMSVPQVRSITIFGTFDDIMPHLKSYGVLRVLDLSGSYYDGVCADFSAIGYLFQLRYLNLAGTFTRELPDEIGNLQFLQVLDVSMGNSSGNVYLKELPSTVLMLRRLMYVRFEARETKLPDGWGNNWTSVEVLGCVTVCSVKNAKELGNLTRLRELEILLYEGLEIEEAFVESLCNLHNIQILVMEGYYSLDLLAERWVPPRCLRGFHAERHEFSTMPVWIKAHLSNLSELSFRVKELQQEDMRNLGSLPALCSLRIQTDHQKQTMLLTGDNGFPSLVDFKLLSTSHGYRRAVVFGKGALPRAENVQINICLGKDGDLESSLGNLVSLRSVIVSTGYATGDAARQHAAEALAAARHAVRVHPNRPSFSVDSSYAYPYGNEDDEC